MILTKAQAEAVYSVMCALNNVGGRADIAIDAKHLKIIEATDGQIAIWVKNFPEEVYANQSAFAAAYGLS